MRGAALSEEGKSIIAIPSTTSKGISRIVSQLQPGASVVTTRAHALCSYRVRRCPPGKNLRQRAQALLISPTGIIAKHWKRTLLKYLRYSDKYRFYEKVAIRPAALHHHGNGPRTGHTGCC
ncbi:acetyl-CoA hydrolase/transferase C-terminal domain-containing protein [Chitinophaga sp. OAE865]|uniref:acetyl-CoA hydrolase/transferase C-terminal domain-containing protein n=1 Tax=Chitinophaga sp. OAE865 TaxID=2817898 RepID=UPI003396B2B5